MKSDPEKHHRHSLRIKNRDYSRDGYYFVTICARNRENIFADFRVDGGPPQSRGNREGYPYNKTITKTLVLTIAGKIIENNWRKINNQNVKTDAFMIMPNHIHGIIIIKSHCHRVGVRLALTPDNGHPRGVPLQQEMAPAPDVINEIGQPQGLPLQHEMAPAPDVINEIGQPQGLPLHKENAPTPDSPGHDKWYPQGQHKSSADFGGYDLSATEGGLPLQHEMASTLDSHNNDQGQPQGLPLQKEMAPAPTLGSIIGAFKSRCALEYLKFIDDNGLNESAKIWQRNYYEQIIRDRKELATIRNYIRANPANWHEDEENPINI